MKRVTRIFLNVLIGMFILLGVIWLLGRSLGERQPSYSGKSMDLWVRHLESHDAAASNQAYEVVNTEIVPKLVEQMFHDTHDSKLRLTLIQTLNGVPGVQIPYKEAAVRRGEAARSLGELGPAGKSAVPSLIQLLNGPEGALRECAIGSLGQIHSSPEVVVPLLIPFLTNNDLSDQAALALGNYGGAAREAFPKIVPLLHAREKEARRAARIALQQIDPAAAARAK